MPSLIFAPAVTKNFAVQGTDEWRSSIALFLVTMTVKCAGMNASDAQKIVNLARSRVARRSGNLFNSIHAGQDKDGNWFVTADAYNTEYDDTFYARFVELGTKPGIRGRSSAVADSEYFQGDAIEGRRGRRRVYKPGSRARSRRQYRTHPGSAAKPFLLNSAEEVLGDRYERATVVVGSSAKETGLA